jgi:hypothetical protein
MRHLCLLILLVSGGCASGKTNPPGLGENQILSVEERSAVQSVRIFFGHQSVGRNILTGIAEFAPELSVVTTTDPGTIEGPALIEASIGRNGDPRSKDHAFLEAVSKLGSEDIATYKYCYADMLAETDPDSLFAHYRNTLDAAARSGVRTVAITMPLTTVAPTWKRWIKRALGKTTDLELNARRQHFNELLRKANMDRPLIDLARLESTLEDGSSRSASFDDRPVEILASEYTDDGAHLNTRGRRHVAPLFLRALSGAIND